MTEQKWDNTIVDLPGASFLQTVEWSHIKGPVGWIPQFKTWADKDSATYAAAMTLYRSPSRLPFSVAYVPRGPLVDWTDPAKFVPVVEHLIQQAKDRNAILLKIDPDLPVGDGIPGTETECHNPDGLAVQEYLKNNGWVFSSDQIQFRNTVEIDLSLPDEALLMKMHPKTRYNIRLAEKKGVLVSQTTEDEWPDIFRLYSETANRDGFVIRPWEYYESVWSNLTRSNMATCLKAEVDGKLIAAIWVIGFGKKAHYLYGMSGTTHREYMPNHLLQWRGILLAKSQGRTTYDMWGAPNEFVAGDSLSGVFRFKQGFGGKVVRTIGAWDYPIRPVAYRLYSSVLPGILNIMRAFGRSRTRKLLSN